MLLYSPAALVRLQPPHGAREPTARVACSGEAVQGCAKANANRIELVELENVIGDHPREGLTEGPVSAQSSASRRSPWKIVVLGVTKLGGLLRVLVSRAQPASCEGSITQVMRRSVVKARRSVELPRRSCDLTACTGDLLSKSRGDLIGASRSCRASSTRYDFWAQMVYQEGSGQVSLPR